MNEKSSSDSLIDLIRERMKLKSEECEKFFIRPPVDQISNLGIGLEQKQSEHDACQDNSVSEIEQKPNDFYTERPLKQTNFSERARFSPNPLNKEPDDLTVALSDMIVTVVKSSLDQWVAQRLTKVVQTELSRLNKEVIKEICSQFKGSLD